MRGKWSRMCQPDRQPTLIGRLIGRLLDPGYKLLHREPRTQRGRFAHRFTPENRVTLLYVCCQIGMRPPSKCLAASIERRSPVRSPLKSILYAAESRQFTEQAKIFLGL